MTIPALTIAALLFQPAAAPAGWVAGGGLGNGARTFDAEHQRGQSPREVPVVGLEGISGVLGVLSASPQRPEPLPSLPVTHLDDRGRAALLDAPRKLSLTFSEPMAVRDVLSFLLRGTPFSLVFDPAVSGTFAGELKDVTLRQALESVLFPLALDYHAEGMILRVFPRRPQTRFFNIDHVAATRGSTDFFTETAAGVQSILSASGKYHVDRQAALVHVTDFADRLDAVGAYLETAHVRVSRQIRLQARIFEVTRTHASPIEWAALAARPHSGIRRASAEAAGWHVEDFDALLKTVGEIGSVRYIAAPALLAMNNEPAVLRAEDSAAQSELRLSVTPQIAADGLIQMHVTPSYSEGRRIAAPAGDVGTKFTMSLDTVVRLPDGATVLIAGVLRRSEAGGPAELVILLTATAVAPIAHGGR